MGAALGLAEPLARIQELHSVQPQPRRSLASAPGLEPGRDLGPPAQTPRLKQTVLLALRPALMARLGLGAWEQRLE